MIFALLFFSTCHSGPARQEANSRHMGWTHIQLMRGIVGSRGIQRVSPQRWERFTWVLSGVEWERVRLC